ncbi:hypothetical protein QBZ16_004449 [Prototheca wickerhamii]|uniref:RRM domain-containing protein n=1 Tax=Prototheca wickerhamii TaxID=3111 RepID=A0AAD9II94_PROWI|nr:hypothetical protein QBZ16_004449 [Prototheca wickerhamii]
MAEEEVMRVGRRVYVSNLAWRTSWQDLKDHFRTAGEVVYSNVIKDADGRSKGWGIVEFSQPEEAVEAISTLNGSELGGRNIMVREDREDRDVKQYNAENGIAPPPQAPRAPRAAAAAAAAPAEGAAAGAPAPEPVSSGLQIVVHGLPFAYTWQDLKDLFAEVGGIERADIVHGRDGRSRGYGTVRFGTLEEAAAAIEQFNNTELEGRTLSVKLDAYA